MPRKEVDYSKTVIYKIVCNDLLVTDLYVGHTTHFRNRKSEHKCYCKASDIKIYKTIRDNGNWENWTMVQIEEYPCANGNEARARERYWFEQLNATLNMQFPQRNRAEYYIENKDKILENIKEYRNRNKDKIKKKRENNKEIISVQKKQYYNINKDKIKEYYQINKYTCECGSICRLDSKTKHFKSLKHINYLNLQKENI